MKKVTILVVALMLCGMTFAAGKNVAEIDQRIAAPSFSPLDGTWCSQPNLAIPDNDSGEAVDLLAITDAETIANLTVSLQIEHTWTGDLRAELSNGSCTIQLLHRIGLNGDECCGCSGDDMDVLFDDAADGGSIEAACDTGPSGGAAGTFTPGDPQGNGIWPTAMADCNGESTAGDWVLTVTDGAGGDEGTLLEWCITNTTGGTGDGGGSVVPATSTTGVIILAVLLMIGGSLFVVLRRRTA